MQEILDYSINEQINIRPKLFQSAELLLLLTYSILFLFLSYLYIIDINMGGFISLLLIGTNLWFVYLTRKATLEYNSNNNFTHLKRLKNSGLRLFSTCISIFLFFCILAVVINLFFGKTTLSTTNTSSSFVVYSSLGFVLFLIVIQIYHTILMADIFNLVPEN